MLVDETIEAFSFKKDKEKRNNTAYCCNARGALATTYCPGRATVAMVFIMISRRKRENSRDNPVASPFMDAVKVHPGKLAGSHVPSTKLLVESEGCYTKFPLQDVESRTMWNFLLLLLLHLFLSCFFRRLSSILYPLPPFLVVCSFRLRLVLSLLPLSSSLFSTSHFVCPSSSHFRSADCSFPSFFFSSTSSSLFSSPHFACFVYLFEFFQLFSQSPPSAAGLSAWRYSTKVSFKFYPLNLQFNEKFVEARVTFPSQ